ncbi:hypothetical protein HU200_041184 [Digitaria exilis]|uniref:Disease resistance R13L4/SHOC-2-like LRR domain-containing protein n=1 Tax=Digitaria exilis TaxID=1010633 RepID=A0A835B839_9POAL|nr:hypothetical protein HU200_041184 [Digitaria exilis]
MEDNLVIALEGSCSPNTQRSGRHLTIRSSWDRDTNVFKSIDFSRLRSLTVVGEWKSFFISDKFLMGVLRVLDLEGSMGATYDDLEDIGKLLPRLKFLSLRGCIQIKRLPDSFGDLRQLQTLDVRHTSIVMLPRAIFQIEKLQYVRAGISTWHADDDMLTSVPVVYVNQTSAKTENSDGSSAPPVATPSHGHDDTTPVPPAEQDVDGSLPHKENRQDSTQGEAVPPQQAEQKNKKTWTSWLGLSKPCARAQNEGGKAILKKKELNKLTQLRKLGVSGINNGNIKDLFSAISGHHHLESLSLRLDEDNFPDDISLPKTVAETLKSLKLYGNMKKLPITWIEQLGNLKKLKLELTISGQDDIDAFSGLPLNKKVLTRLCVKLNPGGKLRFGSGPQKLYESFAVLEIDCMSSSEVTFGNLMMTYVELLKVRCSKEVSLTFSGLNCLYSLKEVWLMGSFDDDTLKQEMQQQLGKHQNKPVLKLVKQHSS